MSYNPNILREMLRARSLTHGQLGTRLGLNRIELEREINREPEPKQSVLSKIARELALPSFVFYMERPPALHDIIPDFRSDDAAPSAKSRETVEAIQFAEGIQRAAKSHDVVGAAQDLPRLTTRTAKLEEFALQMRDFFDISRDDQSEAKDAQAFYIICRKKIEDKGIFVLHSSFPETDGSGFCLADPSHPVIVVNTRKQTPGRRLFTLVHELAHVLMGRTGISDPAIAKNSVEKICNRFAGYFLVPRDFVSFLLGKRDVSTNPDLDEVARISRRLKISQEATVFRLEQLKVFDEGSYSSWKRAISKIGNPDFATKKGGGAGGPPPQEKVKLARYGFRFADAFAPVLEGGKISEINLFRSSGLKPKYQRAYFSFARSLTRSQLQALELEDD